MKIPYLVSILFLASLTFCQAQFAVGLHTGINVSHINSNFLEETYDGKLKNMFYGASPQYAITEKWNLVLALQYSPKGFNSQDLIIDYKYKLTYLDFLPEIEYELHNNLKAGVGINYGILLDEEYYDDDQGWVSISYLNNTPKRDFGLSLKLQAQLKQYYLYVRYNHGLQDLTDLTFTNSGGVEELEIDQYNRNIQIGIGYLIEKNSIPKLVKGKSEFGIRSGINLSNMNYYFDGTKPPGQETTTKFEIGAFYSSELSSKLNYSIEFNYFESGIEIPELEFQLDAKSVESNFLVLFPLIEKRFFPSVFAGLGINKYLKVMDSTGYDYDLSHESINPWGLNLLTGIRVNYDLKPITLFIDSRYKKALNNFIYDTGYEDFDLKMNKEEFVISLGVKIKIKRRPEPTLN